MKNYNKLDANTAMVTMVQVGKDTMETDINSDLFVSRLSNRFFNDLRSKDQLGYVCFCMKKVVDGIIYIVTGVQSSWASPDTIQGRLDVFNSKLGKYVGEGVKQEEWVEELGNLVANLSVPPKTLGEAFCRFWGEIVSERYNFDYRNKKKELALELSKKTVPFKSFEPANYLGRTRMRFIVETNQDFKSGKIDGEEVKQQSFQAQSPNDRQFTSKEIPITEEKGVSVFSSNEKSLSMMISAPMRELYRET